MCNIKKQIAKYRFSEFADVYLGFKIKPTKRIIGFIHKFSTTFSGIQKHTQLVPFLKNKPFSKLTAAYKLSRGATLSGKKSVYTKGSVSKKRFAAYTKSLKTVNGLAIPVCIEKDVLTFKLSCTILTIAGSVMRIPFTYKLLLFRLLIAAKFAGLAVMRGANYHLYEHRFCEVISLLKARDRVCFVAVTHDSKIALARAAGMYASIISKKKDTKKTVVIVRLPSTELKLVDSLTTVLIGSVAVSQRLLFKNTKAGYWRNIGVKPMVRGVVKNPVDHPHGGRERTILWPRTPWGKSTK